MTKVIKGGTVCTADRSWKADVLIDGETIKQIGENLSEQSATSINLPMKAESP